MGVGVFVGVAVGAGVLVGSGVAVAVAVAVAVDKAVAVGGGVGAGAQAASSREKNAKSKVQTVSVDLIIASVVLESRIQIAVVKWILSHQSFGARGLEQCVVTADENGKDILLFQRCVEV